MKTYAYHSRKTTFTKREQKLLFHFARYVWWKEREDLIRNEPYRIIANAMRYANTREEYSKLFGFRKKNLKKALKLAQSGWFDAKNWVFGIIFYLDCKLKFQR